MATKFECDICLKQFPLSSALRRMSIPRTYRGAGGAGFDGQGQGGAGTIVRVQEYDTCAECAWTVGDVILQAKEDAKGKISVSGE